MIVEKNIKDWIYNVLSKPNASFNNLPPCPYAKQAYIQKKILILDSIGNENLQELLETYEVVIYAFNPNDISSKELYNLSVLLSNDNIVALDDHPEYEEKVNDVILNNGEYALLLVQERNKLNVARKFLKSKGYYNNWDPKYLKEVFSV